ncbi:MAG: type II toxin-antitoxin system RelE/ParE family toxin [Sporichthyaceae bacterium]
MTLQVVWEETAVSQAAEFLDDPQGLQDALDAVAMLAVDPRPVTSFPYGSPDRRRLRVGRYRVMYDIGAESISVWRIARLIAER